MLPFTLDDHFAYSYGDSPPFDCSQRGDGSGLWCTYSRAQREPETFKSEVIRVAGLLSEEAASRRRKLVVLLSGGVDSEIVVKGCVAAGVEFETVSFRFRNGLNVHEIEHIELAKRKYKTRHSYLDIDIHRWLRSTELEDLFHGSMATSLNLLPHMKLMNHVWFEMNGLPVLGNGDVYLENENGIWHYVELEYMLAWYRHAIRFGIIGGIGFFQHTPEITLALLREPKLQRLGRNQDSFANKAYETSKFVKYALYRKIWPDIALRPKLGGHELVKQLYLTREAELLSGRDIWEQKFKVTYDDFRSQMEPRGTAYLQDELQLAQRTGS